VIPIIQEQKLWGLLIAHQCDRHRTWQEWEIELLKQLSSQFAIAIQQASLYQQVQEELADKDALYLQLANELHQKKVGMGLGLAFVKQIVELHGGRIGVTSELGVGSCFTIYLPCGQG
jgi:K+-sensing histidine kinase KdpD